MALPPRVLVTGGLGFLGQPVVRALVAGGSAVRVLDDLSSGARPTRPFPDGVEVIEGDVRRREDVDRACHGMSAVVHLAARKATETDHAEALTVNIQGTLSVAEAAQRAGVARLIFASSGSVYGTAGSPPYAESRLPGPRTLQGASKLAAESLLRPFAEREAFQASVLRFFNLYGPGMVRSADGGVLATFASEIGAGRPPPVHGAGEQSRDYVHVDDAVKAVVAALEKRLGTWSVVNVGTGIPTPTRALAELACEALGRLDLEPVSVDEPAGTARASFADIRLAQNLLGFHAKVSLDEGLRRKDWAV